MPLKRHRHHMRTFENCFSGTDAVDWLHNFLRRNRNFGPDVTRQQTIQLLQKFLKANIFENIRHNSRDNSKEFKDNSQLYRFSYNTLSSTRHSPLLALIRTPLSSLNVNRCNKIEVRKKSNLISLFSNAKIGVNNDNIPSSTTHLPECCFIARSLSVKEVENIWKNATTARLKSILGLESLDDLLDSKDINGRTIMHNATRMSKTGVVTLTDKTDDLPHWVMSAMKCLTNWPNASGSSSCLPNYPGFEMDVFKVVKDYFTNIGIPLIPFQFYQLFIYTFETISNCSKVKSPAELGEKKNTETPENNSAASFCTFQNLLLNCPDKTDTDPEQKTSTPLFQTEEINQTQIASHNSKCMECSQSNTSSTPQRCSMFSESPEELHYETAFLTVSPITRLVVSYPKQGGSQSSLYTLTSQATSGIETASTISACSHFVPHIMDRKTFLNEMINYQLSFNTAKSANDLCELSNKQGCKHSCNDPELQETPRCSSVDNLNQTSIWESQNKKCSSLSVMTLPRKLTPCNSFLSRDRKYGSLRHNMYEQKLKTDEHIHTPTTCRKEQHSRRDEASMSSLHSYCTAPSSRNSWNKCHSYSKSDCSNNYEKANSVARDFQEISQPISNHSFEENLNLEQEVSNQSSPPDTRKGRWIGPHWKKPTFQFARKTTLNSFQIPFYRPPTPVSCSKHVNLKVTSWNEHLENVACDQILPPRPEPEGQSFDYQLDEVLKNKVISALQICLLFLPSANRRHLHLLLRMMYKVLMNTKLNLHPLLSTKNFLLNTFARSIICAENEIDYNELQALRLISLLLDECELVFQHSVDLKSDVEDRLAQLQRGRIKYTLDDCCTLAYCEQVSLPQYKEQKNALSQQALTNLLENLVSDSKMSEKERRKKIKQFKESHPDIFQNRFPTAASEAILFAKRPKQTLLSRILSVRL